MKSYPLIFIFILVSNFAFGQSPCFPGTPGSPGGNEPPGCFLCGNIFSGSTEGYDSTSISSDNFPCGEIENNQFAYFIADSSRHFSAQFFDGCVGGGGVEIALYDQNFNLISGCFSKDSMATTPIISQTGLIPGEVYWILIDGFEGRNCSFQIVGISGHQTSNSLPNHMSPQFFLEDSIACLSKSTSFRITPVAGASGYFWRPQGSIKVTSGGSPLDTFISLEHSATGSYLLLVAPIFECFMGNSGRIWYDVINPTSKDSTIICPGDIYETNGYQFDSAGIFEFTASVQSNFGCDSTIILDLKIPDTSRVILSCVQDSFLNSISIGWNKKSLADQYEIYINGSLISVQNHVGYIYHPNSSGEEIDIKIQPIGSHGCEYAPGYLICTAPDLSNSNAIFEKELVSVFPNPSSGVFKIYSKEKIEKVEVFDFSGKEVKAVSDVEIDLSEFESGVYFLKIYFGEEVVLKKVIKI